MAAIVNAVTGWNACSIITSSESILTSDPCVIQALKLLDGYTQHMPVVPVSYRIALAVVPPGMRATTDAALTVPPEALPPDHQLPESVPSSTMSYKGLIRT